MDVPPVPPAAALPAADLRAAAAAGVPVRRRHVLHVFPSFGIGGVPLRIVRLINHFGPGLRHTVVALDNDFRAADGLSPTLDVRLLRFEQRRSGFARRVSAIGGELRRLRPDLLVTYNWGAIEWAAANRIFAGLSHVHIEAGFSRREADRQLRRRVLFRRWALRGCARVIVPSRTLEDVARRVWKLPAAQVMLIPNGVDLDRFADPAQAKGAVARGPGEIVIGTVAPLRPEKNIGRLLRAFAALDRTLATRLVIAGDGEERPYLEQLAAQLGIGQRVVFTGRVAPETVLGSLDIFAMSSDTEQMPNALLEAMAASRPVVSVDVGDIGVILGAASREFVVPRDDPAAFVAALDKLVRDPARRERLGRENRRRVTELFGQDRMFAAYSAIFGVEAVPPSGAAMAPS
jgi:glycosyltransferase involved in cell wall biosynthesis